MDEGYIKFQCHWEQKGIDIIDEVFDELNHYRSELFKLGLIGAYPDGIGFGNISTRLDNNQFLISGSATGNISVLNRSHYAIVNDYNIEANEVYCMGETKASSESMSHAALYESDANIKAIIHIHNLDLWQKLKKDYPVTPDDISYGTPEMAYSIMDVYKQSELSIKKLLVMLGHKEGIISFGGNVKEAFKNLVTLYKV